MFYRDSLSDEPNTEVVFTDDDGRSATCSLSSSPSSLSDYSILARFATSSDFYFRAMIFCAKLNIDLFVGDVFFYGFALGLTMYYSLFDGRFGLIL